MGRTVFTSVHADPPHSGHLELFTRAKEYAGPDGTLIVIVDNNGQTLRKKSYVFMDDVERMKLIGAFRVVDEVVLSIDQGPDVSDTIRMLAKTRLLDAMIKGGDSKLGVNVPEVAVCRELGIEVKDGFGEKIQSSSWLIGAALKNIASIQAST